MNDNANQTTGSIATDLGLSADEMAYAIAQQNVAAASGEIQSTNTPLHPDVKAVVEAFSLVPANNTEPEEELLAVLTGYRIAAQTRFAHLLTGMANSTAEAIRYIAEAELHLADHIAQQKTANEKGA